MIGGGDIRHDVPQLSGWGSRPSRPPLWSQWEIVFKLCNILQYLHNMKQSRKILYPGKSSPLFTVAMVPGLSEQPFQCFCDILQELFCVPDGVFLKNIFSCSFSWWFSVLESAFQMLSNLSVVARIATACNNLPKRQDTFFLGSCIRFFQYWLFLWLSDSDCSTGNILLRRRTRRDISGSGWSARLHCPRQWIALVM